MEKRTPQELAKAITKINWINVQCDSPSENFGVTLLMHELEQMDSKQALRLLMKVIEAKELSALPGEDNPFKDMGNYSYIEHQLNDYPTEEVT